ncbi:HutD/Ves family protein [Paraburkholderia rhynchosiae]|uniref:HutD/Ves family protein n=1 Tax=Paraburkholderia rhynchosiae TaxID=487049 RepID=UPI001FD1F37D
MTRTLATGGSQWRISLAEVERDGPYSRFEGVSRTSLVLRGNGVTLRDHNAVVRLEPFKAVEYDGDLAWNASLVDGPVTALNVMCAQGQYRTRVWTIADPIVVRPNCAAVVVALDCGCTYSEPDTHLSGTLEQGQMLVINEVTRPLRLVPTEVPSLLRGQMNRAVLVTIEPSRFV